MRPVEENHSKWERYYFSAMSLPVAAVYNPVLDDAKLARRMQDEENGMHRIPIATVMPPPPPRMEVRYGTWRPPPPEPVVVYRDDAAEAFVLVFFFTFFLLFLILLIIYA